MLGGIFHLHTNLTRCDKSTDSVCSRLSAALPAVAIILFHIHQFHIAHTLHYGAHMQLSLSEYVAEIMKGTKVLTLGAGREVLPPTTWR